MIDAKELRIGNRFNRELYTQRGTEYDPDFILTEQWMAKLFTEYTSLALNDLFPIPLTPEILEKCGLEVKNDNPKQKPHYEGDVIFNLLDFEFSNSEKGNDSGFYSYQINNGDTVIKSVHQLQNLYYALTNKELEINL